MYLESVELIALEDENCDITLTSHLTESLKC